MRYWIPLCVVLLASVSVTLAQTPPNEINDALSRLSQAVGTNVTLTDLDQWRWTDQTYPDGSLGCPQEGQTYAQVPTRGYAFFLTYNGVTFDYRVPRSGGTMVLCNNPDLSQIQTSAPVETEEVETEESRDSQQPAPTFPPSNFYPCPNALTGNVPSRLNAGFRGRYIGATNLNLRDEPSRTANSVGSIQPGTEFNVLDGPQCGPTFTWWQIDTGTSVGWVGEVNPGDSSYWLEPTAGTSLPDQPLPDLDSTRQTLTAENAASITRLLTQPNAAGQQLIVGETPTHPNGFVAVVSSDEIQQYATATPSEPIATLAVRNAQHATYMPDNFTIAAIYTNPQNGEPGLALTSATGGTGGGSPLGTDFTAGLAYIPTLELLAFGGSDNIQLYDPATRSVAAQLPLAEAPLELDVAGTTLAAITASGRLVIFDISTRSQTLEVAAATDSPEVTIALSPDGTAAAVSTTAGVRVLDTTTGEEQLNLSTEGEQITAVVFNPTGDLLVGGGTSLHMWNAADGQALLRASLEGTVVEDIAFSIDGTLLNVLGAESGWSIWGTP